MVNDYNWLVVYLPLWKNMSSSVGIIIPNIWKNHQPNDIFSNPATTNLLHAEDSLSKLRHYLLPSFILCGQRQDVFPVLTALSHCVDSEVPADTLHAQLKAGLRRKDIKISKSLLKI